MIINTISELINYVSENSNFLSNHFLNPKRKNFKKREQNYYFKNQKDIFINLFDKFNDIVNNIIPDQEYNYSTNNSIPYLYCEKNNNQKASFICFSNNCPFKIFSHSCLKDHKKKCKNNVELINAYQLKSKGNIENYFNENNFKFESEEQKIKDEFEDLKNEIFFMIDSYKEIIINKFKSETKEYNFKNLNQKINQNYNSCKGKI